jgi:predicted Zn-dependent protease
MTRIRRAALAAAILASISSARAKEDKWVEARSKNFIVVTNADARQARNTAIQFEQIRELFQSSFIFAKDRPTPVITILAAKDENTLRSLLPEYWETKGHLHPAGIFLNSQYQMQIAVQLSGLGDNPYEAIYHEYYHSLTLPFFPALPLWISEGMADFYGNSKIVDKTAYLGMPDAGLIELIHEQPMLALAGLFHVDHSSPYYNESSKASIFYAESWALIHYMMMADNGAHRQQLMTYLDALSHGDTQDAAAAKAFGDLGKLQKELISYAGNNSFYEFHTPAPPKVPESDVQVRPLSDAEAAAYRGGFLVLHQQFKEAQPLLEGAVRDDPKLALAQQNLALMYVAQDKSAEARTAVDAAIQLDPKNALTRFLRANLVSRAGGSELQDFQVEADLRAAIEANPNFAPAYGLLASRLANSNKNLPEAFEFAKKGVLLEPGSVSYQLAAAEVLARMRKYDEAQKIATRVAADPLDPQARENANRFLEFLQDIKLEDARRDQFQRSRPSPADEAVETSTSIAESESTEPAPATDARHRIDGSVTDVQCNVQEMIITVMTQDGPVKFHALDNTKIDFISDVPLKSEVFWPCTALKGRNVRVKFLPPAGNAKLQYQGEISGVEIRR